MRRILTLFDDRLRHHELAGIVQMNPSPGSTYWPRRGRTVVARFQEVFGANWLLFLLRFWHRRYGKRLCSGSSPWNPFPTSLRETVSSIVFLIHLQPVRYDYRSNQFLHRDVSVVSDFSQLRVGGVSPRLHELRRIGNLLRTPPLLSAWTSSPPDQSGAI